MEFLFFPDFDKISISFLVLFPSSQIFQISSIVYFCSSCRLFGMRNMSKYILPQPDIPHVQSVDSKRVLLDGTTTDMVSDCLRDRETLTTIMPDLLNTSTVVFKEKKELEFMEMAELI